MICPNCKGSGEVQEHNFDSDPERPFLDIVMCTYCGGSGEVKDDN